jgi:hypothetical protein
MNLEEFRRCYEIDSVLRHVSTFYPPSTALIFEYIRVVSFAEFGELQLIYSLSDQFHTIHRVCQVIGERVEEVCVVLVLYLSFGGRSGRRPQTISSGPRCCKL